MAQAPELLGLACEIADSVAVAVPRGWSQVTLSLDVRGGQVRVTGMDAQLKDAPPPKPELGMDVAARIGGLSAALTDVLHQLHHQGIEWDAAKATLSRPGPSQIVLSMFNADGRPVSAVSIPKEMIDALFVSEPLLDALARSQAQMDLLESETSARLAGLAKWHYSQPERKATFEFGDRPKVEIPAQILGMWSPEEEAWLWGWANSAIEPGCTDLVEAAFAPDDRAPGLAVFWREKYPCEETFAHNIARLAAVQMNAKGVFRGRAGKATIYLALME